MAPHAREKHFSPLVLADRLIGLAQEADRGGCVETAALLIDLVYFVLDPAERGHGSRPRRVSKTGPAWPVSRMRLAANPAVP